MDSWSFVVTFEIGKSKSSNVFSRVLAILGSLYFQRNFESASQFLQKQGSWHFGDQFAILIAVSLPVHKDRLTVHIFRPSLLSLNNVL